MTDTQQQPSDGQLLDIAGLIEDIAINYANGHATDFREAAGLILAAQRPDLGGAIEQISTVDIDPECVRAVDEHFFDLVAPTEIGAGDVSVSTCDAAERLEHVMSEHMTSEAIKGWIGACETELERNALRELIGHRLLAKDKFLASKSSNTQELDWLVANLAAYIRANDGTDDAHSLLAHADAILARDPLAAPAQADSAPIAAARWKLVPTKHNGRAGLTDAMMRAFYTAFEANSQRGDFERLNAGYNAMLEAAPIAPATAAHAGAMTESQKIGLLTHADDMAANGWEDDADLIRALVSANHRAAAPTPIAPTAGAEPVAWFRKTDSEPETNGWTPLYAAGKVTADAGAQEAAMHSAIKFLSKRDQGRVMGAFRTALASSAVEQTASDALLYEHDDGRYAVATTAEHAVFANGQPAWHRVGPIPVHGFASQTASDAVDVQTVAYMHRWPGCAWELDFADDDGKLRSPHGKAIPLIAVDGECGHKPGDACHNSTPGARAIALPDFPDPVLWAIKSRAAMLTDEWAEGLAVEPSPEACDARFVREIVRLISIQSLPGSDSGDVRASVLEEAAKLAEQWGEARMPEHGGNALRNCAVAIRALKESK